MTGCVLGAAGAASAVSVVLMRLVLGSAIDAAPSVCENPTAEAELSGLRAFDHATAEYDGLSTPESTETNYESEIRWGQVRDRYRLFLAYPEAVVRWPELAAIARDRAEKIDQLVVDLAQMQELEMQAKALEEADKAVRAQERLDRRKRIHVEPTNDCNLSGGD